MLQLGLQPLALLNRLVVVRQCGRGIVNDELSGDPFANCLFCIEQDNNLYLVPADFVHNTQAARRSC